MIAPTLTDQTELGDALITNILSARREFKALLPQFDRRIWENAQLIEAIRAYLTSNSLSRVAICLQDATDARADAPRLMTLCERIPSRCEIRLAHEEHQLLHESFLLFDRRAYLRRATPLERNWSTQVKPPNQADRLHKLFYQVWGEATVHPNLRRLSL